MISLSVFFWHLYPNSVLMVINQPCLSTPNQVYNITKGIAFKELERRMFFEYTHFTHSYLLWYACVCQGQAIHVLLETIFLRAFLILNISSTRPPSHWLLETAFSESPTCPGDFSDQLTNLSFLPGTVHYSVVTGVTSVTIQLGLNTNIGHFSRHQITGNQYQVEIIAQFVEFL